MPDFGKLADKARNLFGQHSDKTDEGIQKAGEFADQETGGRYSDQIQQGQQRAQDHIGGGGGQQGQDQGGQYGEDQGGQQGQDQGGQQGSFGQDQGGQSSQDQGGYGNQ